MQWWAWIAVGAMLLGSELAFVDAQFYLVFVGACRAASSGFLQLAGRASRRLAAMGAVRACLPPLSMVIFRRRIYERMRRKLPAMKQGRPARPWCCRRSCRPASPAAWNIRGSSWSAHQRRHVGRSPPGHGRASSASTA